MKIMTCPINGARPVSEFAYAGALRDMPDPATATDEQWAAYVFNQQGKAGIKREWWYHIASGVWFIAERDTTVDRVIRTYLFGKEAA